MLIKHPENMMDKQKMTLPLTLIKDRDKRCGRGFIINWTKFNQTIPKYQICECNKNNIFIKSKT